ncbi:MAG: DHH family phosphoesterase [Planctomycetota bacterium]|jgi:phosphoesterase RecJ-like protein
MTDYASNTTYDGIAQRLTSAQRVLIMTHQKPDGDAIGSVLALQRALAGRGQVAEIFLLGPLEPCLETVIGATPFRLADADPPGDEYDVAVVLDTGAWVQLGALADWVRPRSERVLGIDHHPHGEDVASLRLVDPSAASTTQMLVELLDAMGCPLTGGPGGVAEALFVGLATDTGWFRYGNADAAAFAVASRLLEQGVDKSGLYQVIEESHRPARLGLEGRALSSLAYAGDGAAAVMVLRRSDFEATGGSLEDLTGLVNMPMIVGAVRVSILLVETAGGQTKMSFRSKPAPRDAGAAAAVDVNVLAQQFGGGGHVHAAGALVHRPLNEVRAQVIGALDAPGAAG